MHNLTKAEQIADRALLEVGSHVAAVLKAENYDVEKAAFFTGAKENPEFKYEQKMHDAMYLMTKIHKISFPDTPLGQLLEVRARELSSIVDFAFPQDSAAATRASIEIFGKPTDEHVKMSKKITAGGVQEKHMELKLDTAKVIERLEGALKTYGLSNWKVRPEHAVSQGIAVHGKSKEVHVQKKVTLSLEELEMMVTHEIETHALISENAEAQPIKLLNIGMTRWLRTQEGLAAYNVVQQHPEGSERPMFHWAARTLAVRTALEGSFRSVFEMLTGLGFNNEYAFSMAFKVKRGLPTTSDPGAYTRDYVYFAGKQDIEKFVADGGDLRDLYVGRLNINMLPLLKKVRGMQKAKYLPRFLQE